MNRGCGSTLPTSPWSPAIRWSSAVPCDGSVRACDVATGQERWRFYTEGPVRFAPVLTADRVFAGSDDGYLYCLRLADGTLLWKVRGAPEDAPDRRHLGNNRLISHWPVRGGPVLADGSIYFAAGLWPTMGVYVVAVDAETGAVRWRNAKLAELENIRLDHNEMGTSGLSPQGYLLVHGDLLLVPNGRSMPAALNRQTGELVYYIQGYRNGDCRVVAGDDVALVGETGVVDLRTGREVGSRWAAAGADAPKAFDHARFHLFEGPIHPYKMFPGCTWRSVLADGLAFGLEAGVFYAYDLRRAGISEYESKNGDRVLKPWRWDAPLVWKCGTAQRRRGPRAGRQGGPPAVRLRRQTPAGGEYPRQRPRAADRLADGFGCRGDVADRRRWPVVRGHQDGRNPLFRPAERRGGRRPDAASETIGRGPRRRSDRDRDPRSQRRSRRLLRPVGRGPRRCPARIAAAIQFQVHRRRREPRGDQLAARGTRRPRHVRLARRAVRGRSRPFSVAALPGQPDRGGGSDRGRIPRHGGEAV